MNTAPLTSDQARDMIRQRIISREWWTIFPMNSPDILDDLEKAYYMKENNADFEIIISPMLPGLAIAQAKKEHLSAANLARFLSERPESILTLSTHDLQQRDIIQFGDTAIPNDLYIEGMAAFSRWIGPLPE